MQALQKQLGFPNSLFASSQNFLTIGSPKSARCDDLESLKERKCKQIENPRGSITVDKDRPVTVRKDRTEKLKPEQITQIQPQKLTLKLRSGKHIIHCSIYVFVINYRNVKNVVFREVMSFSVAV